MLLLRQNNVAVHFFMLLLRYMCAAYVGGGCNLCGLETALGVLLDIVRSAESGGMLTNPYKIFYNNTIR